jgi:diadenosine tetraphosphate (Ap4A) HIT family hydrolase
MRRCKGCLLPVVFKIRKATDESEKEAAAALVAEHEKNDPRKMKLREYFIHNFRGKFLLDHCLQPNVPGHLVLQPIEHVKQLHDISVGLSDNDAKEMILVVKRVSRLLEEVLIELNCPPERIYICSFNESPEWHLHFHIIPRAKQEVILGPNLLAGNPRKIAKEEIANVVALLRERLGRE